MEDGNSLIVRVKAMQKIAISLIRLPPLLQIIFKMTLSPLKKLTKKTPNNFQMIFSVRPVIKIFFFKFYLSIYILFLYLIKIKIESFRSCMTLPTNTDDNNNILSPIKSGNIKQQKF